MTNELNWAPEACTLPTAEQPLRVQEFGQLFATSLREIDRATPTRLRLVLEAPARDEAKRLVEAESACCTFFAFAVSDPADGRFNVDIEVSSTHIDVLDAIAAQAAAAWKPA